MLESERAGGRISKDKEKPDFENSLERGMVECKYASQICVKISCFYSNSRGMSGPTSGGHNLQRSDRDWCPLIRPITPLLHGKLL